MKRNKNLNFNFDYFVKYSEAVGFKLSIDGIFKPLNEGIYFIVYGLNPPGGFYQDVIRKDSTYTRFKLDWESSVNFPMFRENY